MDYEERPSTVQSCAGHSLWEAEAEPELWREGGTGGAGEELARREAQRTDAATSSAPTSSLGAASCRSHPLPRRLAPED